MLNRSHGCEYARVHQSAPVAAIQQPNRNMEIQMDKSNKICLQLAHYFRLLHRCVVFKIYIFLVGNKVEEKNYMGKRNSSPTLVDLPNHFLSLKNQILEKRCI